MTSQQESNEEQSSNQQPNEPLNTEPEQGSDLADRLKEVEGVSDDAAIFLAENWPRFLGFVALLILAVFGYNQFQSSTEGKRAQASDGFNRIQQSLKEIENNPEGSEETLQSSTRAFEDSLDVLKSKYPNSAYAKFAPLYAAKKLMAENKQSEARQLLQNFVGSRFSSNGVSQVSTQTPEDIAIELAGLVEAKSWLVGESPNVEEARKRLEGVAKGSDMVAGEALVALARIASSPEEKTNLKTVANQVLDRSPQLREQVQAVFTLEGISLEE